MDKNNLIDHLSKQEGHIEFEIVSLSNFIGSVNKSFISTAHRTAYYNLIFITQGKGTHEIDFVEYPVKTNELMLISRNRVHRFRNCENLEGYIMRFSEGFLCELLSDESSCVKDLFKTSHLNPHLKDIDVYAPILKSSLNLMLDMHRSMNEVVDRNVIALSFKAFAKTINNIAFDEGPLSHQKSEMFVRFSDLVEENINTEKTVDGYAKMLHVSKKTVNVITRNAVDMSAKQYIIHQLTLKIKRKLSFDHKSINEIADELGFTEPSNMTRFFKKNAGMTPNEFRDMVRNKDDGWINSENIELDYVKKAIEENVYYIPSDVVVPLHKHQDLDEIFYCIKGSGYAVLEDREVMLNPGTAFIAPAGTMHSLRSDGELYVTAFRVPVIDERQHW